MCRLALGQAVFYWSTATSPSGLKCRTWQCLFCHLSKLLIFNILYPYL